MVIHYLKIAVVILVAGILLFGEPFARGAADMVSASVSGVQTFFVELQGNQANSSNAVG